MALVTRSSDADLDTSTGVQVPQVTGNLYAGEDLDPVSPCRIDADGKVYMSNGAADDVNAKVHGFVNRPAKQGQPVTLFPPGTRFRYGSGLTPGAPLHLAGTDGRLDDAATTGDPDGIAHVVNETDIVFARRKL